MNEQSRVQPGDVDWRLTALAFADLVGYSRQMALDSVGTVELWNRLRREVLVPHLERQEGRLVESPGDAVLVQFSSTVKAVTWAIDVQRSVSGGEFVSTTGEPARIRIGINVDDVITDEGNIYSEGVNVASRIHDLAEPGEIVVTGLVREIIGNRLPVSFRDLGKPKLKNIDHSVQVYCVSARQGDSSTTGVHPHISWSSRPTLAVLPFRTIGGDLDDRYFGEGITEDIIAGVSRSRSLFVIARNSTLQFGEAGKNLQEVARSLNVKYLLTGSMRRRADRLRINAELIEVENDRTVWAQRFDGEPEDLFEFQDRIVASILPALEQKVRAIEQERIVNRPTGSLDAYDCVLRALSHLYRFTPESYRESRALLERASSLDPNYAHAHAYLAWCLNFWIGEGRSRNPELDRQTAVASATTAVELDPDDPVVLSIRGHIMAFLEGNPEESIDLFEQALNIDENLPLAWAVSATAYAYLGNGDETRERFRNVWRLSPFDPLNFFYWTAAGIGEFVAGRNEEAIAWLRRSYRSNPHLVATLRIMAATLALDDQVEEAKRYRDELLAIEPTFRVSKFMAWYPLRRKQDRDKLSLGLITAGFEN